MADFTIYPLNDFAKWVSPKDINSTTGAVTTLTSGTVTAFFATSDSPTATAADQSLSMNAIYSETKNKWLVFFDASVLTASLLATHFASTPPILIVQFVGGFRVVFTGAYSTSRPGTVG